MTSQQPSEAGKRGKIRRRDVKDDDSNVKKTGGSRSERKTPSKSPTSRKRVTPEADRSHLEASSAFYSGPRQRVDFPFSGGHFSAPATGGFLDERLFEDSVDEEEAFRETMNSRIFNNGGERREIFNPPPQPRKPTSTDDEKSSKRKKASKPIQPIPKPNTNIYDIRRKVDQGGGRRFLIVGLNYECNVFGTFADLVSYLKKTLGSRIHQDGGTKHGHGIEPFWIDVQSPTADDMEAIEKYFNLHKLTSEDCLDNDSGEKLEMFPNYLFVCVRTVDKRIENQFEELNVIIFKRFVITVHRGYFEEMEMVLKRIETEFETGLTKNEKRLLYIQDIHQKYDIDRLRKKIENLAETSYSSSSSSSSSTSFLTSTTEEEEDEEEEETTTSGGLDESLEDNVTNLIPDHEHEDDEEEVYPESSDSTIADVDEEGEVEEEEEDEGEEDEEEEDEEKESVVEVQAPSTDSKLEKHKQKQRQQQRHITSPEKQQKKKVDSPKTFSSVMVKLREKKRERRAQRKMRKMSKHTLVNMDSESVRSGAGGGRKHRKKRGKRLRLKMTRIPHPSWILYAFLDVMTDVYVPLTEGLLMEVESVDELVLELKEDSEKIDLLRRLGMTKKQINRMKKLLITKHSIVQLLMSNNTLRYISNDTSVYLRDVVDHLNQCLTHLESAKESLNQSHSNYMIKVSIEIAKSSKQTDAVMNRITLFASILTPLALISGIWGMNVPVPGQYTTNLWWFFGIIVGMFIISGLSLIFLSPQLIPDYYLKIKRFFTCGYCRDRRKRLEYENRYLSYGGE